MSRKKILIIDDEAKIVEMVKAYLEAEGYAVCTAENGVEALARNREYTPDLIILDLMLPDIAGEQVCALIRAEYTVPIIMLTAKSWEESFINGLKIGADDYVTKPFSPKILVAKVGALLRRVSGVHTKGEDIIEYGGIVLNDIAHTVKKNGSPVDLTPNEYSILRVMMQAPGKLFARNELIFIVFGENYAGDERMIDSYIKQLRQKLEDDPKRPAFITTAHGLGYKFGDDSQ
ncbi:MAG: response regulator transcription factor [Synergistaceae bacterium]|nr:response regulator transcription factor [Synergistaceae bacterium]